MFCPTCGVALAQQLKYCNRCGAHLITTKEAAEIELFEKRMDREMEGLFWVTVIGVALVLGGMVLMKKVQFSDWLIAGYMIISAAAFTSYFGLGLWQIRRLARSSIGAKGIVDIETPQTSELNPADVRASLEPATSVTEHTTRTLEPVVKEQINN